MAIISRSCERARSWVSLDLDDELSELEAAMLRAHTARCVPCAQFQAEAAAITHKLRLAPLEPLPAPIALPPRRRVVGRLLQVGDGDIVDVTSIRFHFIRTPGFSTSRNSKVPHNALHDARALREFVLGNER